MSFEIGKGCLNMIIERKYEYFGRLIERDPKAKAIYEKACAFDNRPNEAKRIYDYNLNNRAFEIELGCGIIDPTIIWDGFTELDKSEPYDNGFGLNDVSKIEIMDRNYVATTDWNSEDESLAWIQYAFVHHDYDGIEHIVKVDKIVE